MITSNQLVNFVTFDTYVMKNTKGFTLIETLLATMIISMVILGPLTVSITSSAYAKDTKKVITANYLAHEGLELVRFKRDSVFVECQSGQATCVPISFNASSMENTQQAECAPTVISVLIRLATVSIFNDFPVSLL